MRQIVPIVLGKSGKWLESEFYKDTEIDISEVIAFKEAKSEWYTNWLYLKDGRKILMVGTSTLLGTPALLQAGIEEYV